MIYVRVKVPNTVLKTQPFLERFNGQVMKISKKKVALNREWLPYYELDGAESEKGLPYSFMREWLTPRVEINE